MFHDAALSLFPSLTYFWRKFCLQRYAPSTIRIIDSDKLLLKERNVKDMFKNRIAQRLGTPKLELNQGSVGGVGKNTHNGMNVVQVNHVVQGVLHLLNRFTESNGLSTLICHNNPNDFKKGQILGTTPAVLRNNIDGKLGIPGLNLPDKGLGVTIKPGDRRLSVMNQYAQRRSTIMSTGRLKNARADSNTRSPLFDTRADSTTRSPLF